MIDTDNTPRQLFELTTAMARYHAYRERYEQLSEKE